MDAMILVAQECAKGVAGAVVRGAPFTFLVAFFATLASVMGICVPEHAFAHDGEVQGQVAASEGPAQQAAIVADPDAKDPSEVVPKQFENVTVIEKLGTTLPLNLGLVDEDGREVRLIDIVDGIKPVIFTLNYYSCEMLCNIQLNGFRQGLAGLDPKHLAEAKVVTVSFDPRDGPQQAREKRASVMSTFEGNKPDWRFLTGSKEAVATLAEAFGFQYRWDDATNQFAHTAAIFFVSPRGVVSRYLYGIEYSPRDIRFAWVDASEGKFGSTVERLLLNCFHYDAQTGKYTPFAFRVVRVGGLLTVSCLGIMLGVMWRREKRRLAGGWDRVV
jgi:protein SCO1/2